MSRTALFALTFTGALGALAAVPARAQHIAPVISSVQMAEGFATAFA